MELLIEVGLLDGHRYLLSSVAEGVEISTTIRPNGVFRNYYTMIAVI